MTAYTLFTSYRRVDADGIDRLERQVRLRGVRSWRDVRNIPHGTAMAEQIERAIASETNGLLAFVTESYLVRRTDREDLIWTLEIPSAAKRWQNGDYSLTPFFCGTSPTAFGARCEEEGLPDLSRANGHKVPAAVDGDALEEHFREEARAQLANALSGRDEGLVAVFRSFAMAPLPDAAVLDVDWMRDVDGADPEVWTRDLLPALEDLAGALAGARVRKVELHILARLSAALALGMKLPLATGIEVKPYGREGEGWDPRAGVGGARPLEEERLERSGEAGVTVVEVSVIRDLERDAAGLADAVGAGTHLRLFHREPTRAWDPRPVAGAVSNQVGDAVRALRSKGAREFHLLIAAPAPLALLIGRQLHAIGRVHAYYRADTGEITRSFSAVA